MSTAVRVTPEVQEYEVPPARIGADQLAAFSRFAIANEIVVDVSREGGDMPRDFALEANIGRFALAQLARIFDFEVGVIAVLDEAQFRRRRVHIFRSASTGEPMMAVSLQADQSVEFCEAAKHGLAGLRTAVWLPAKTSSGAS